MEYRGPTAAVYAGAAIRARIAEVESARRDGRRRRSRRRDLRIPPEWVDAVLLLHARSSPASTLRQRSKRHLAPPPIRSRFGCDANVRPAEIARALFAVYGL